MRLEADGYRGMIEPHSGRWTWPWRDMKVGEWFTVRHSDREPGEVVQMAAVRGCQMGKKFETQRYYRPDMMAVECVPKPPPPNKPAAFLDVTSYPTMRALIEKYTDLDPDRFHPDGGAKPGDEGQYDVKFIREFDVQRTHVHQGLEKHFVRVDFDPENSRIKLKVLPRYKPASELLVEDMMA